MSGDIFSDSSWGLECHWCVVWVEARDVAKHPAEPRMLHTSKNYPAQNVTMSQHYSYIIENHPLELILHMA